MASSPKALKTLILGFGVRGRVYAEYAAERPEEIEIVGVADPVAEFPAGAPYPVWKNWEDALGADTAAEAVVLSLPDRLHLEACTRALAKGLHVLLEKPIGCTWSECEAIHAAQRRAGKLVMTCYVLRFSPYYRALAEVVASGRIGELVSIHHLVAVSYGKSAHAFCRGGFAIEEEGTGMLVTKCTHDFDLMLRWIGENRCERLASFGSLKHFRKECRPAGAAERCADCDAAIRARCPFDARRLYCEQQNLRYHFADASDAAMREVVASSPYGRCVYACDNDVVDHQTVLMECKGGLTVTLEMESFCNDQRRVTRFFGTRGEIVADGETIEVRPFIGEREIITPPQHGHHGGGDHDIMPEFVRLARGGSDAEFARIIAHDIESNRLAYMAEESRRTGKVVASDQWGK